MSKWDEQILVVDREILFAKEENSFNGFINEENEKTKSIVSTFSRFEVKRRGDMEEDPSFKQLIGYTIVRDKATNEVLVYTRLSGGGEARLHGKSSVGVGGHMNLEENKDIDTSIKLNVSRELEEEIGISFAENLKDIKFKGLINDDSNEVGKVHIGLVYEVVVDKNKVIITEDDTLEINWLSSTQAREVSNYETWSEFLKEIL